MPGKLESELTPNGPLVPGAHGPKKKGMRKHSPKHAPPTKNKTNQMTIPSIMEIEKWKTLGRVVNVVMSKLFFEW